MGIVKQFLDALRGHQDASRIFYALRNGMPANRREEMPGQFYRGGELSPRQKGMQLNICHDVLAAAGEPAATCPRKGKTSASGMGKVLSCPPVKDWECKPAELFLSAG